MSFSVKFNEQDMKNVELSIKEAFGKVINNNRMLDEVGQLLVSDVVEQTRNEKSIPLGGKDLKLLKEKWITRKGRLATVNTPDANYQEGKSNLTFTGELLNSFKWFIQGPGKILLKFDGTHKKYKNLSGGGGGSGSSNEEIADGLASRGRPFVGVRPVIRRRVQRIVKDYVKRALVVARLSKNNVDS